MSVETVYFNWSRDGDPNDPQYQTCSPNLVCLGQYLGQRFSMTDNGCFQHRPIRGGVAPSVHWWGAATDRNYPDRLIAKTQILDFLIDQSKELHVQSIHDYFGSRIWHAGRTDKISEAHTAWWKTNTTADGMGQSWATYFHIETNPGGWHDSVPIVQRLGLVTPPTTQPTLPPSGVSIVFPRVLKVGDEGADVAVAQTVLRLPGSPSGNKSIVVDGRFGAQTANAVKAFQRLFGLTDDGIIGPKTAAKMVQVANS